MEYYNLFTDGGARGNPGPAATGIFLYDADMKPVADGGEYLGAVSNNVAEYSGLLQGVKLAAENNVKALKVHMDSELVIKQMRGEYKVKHPDMQKLHREVKALLSNFERVEFIHVPREQNKAADARVNEILDAQV